MRADVFTSGAGTITSDASDHATSVSLPTIAVHRSMSDIYARAFSSSQAVRNREPRVLADRADTRTSTCWAYREGCTMRSMKDVPPGVLEYSPALLFIADASGALLHLSKSLADRFGNPTRLTDWPGLDQSFITELASTDDAVIRNLLLKEAGGSQTSVRCVARRAPDGVIHGQLDIVVDPLAGADANRIEHALFRTIMNTLDIVLWVIEPDGKFVFHDGKALATAGMTPGQLLGQNIFELYPANQVAAIRAGADGTTSSYTSEAHGVHWQNWIVPIQPDGKKVDYVAGVSVDVSADVRAKLELERQLATIQEQQKAILELSAPVINVWDSVLTVPLIGTMDNNRANELIERLLGAASRSTTRYVILDLTGVDALDTSIAGHLLRLLRSLRLLGVEGLVTGISPQVSQTMVGLGVELEDVRTFRSLRESLRFCMKAILAESSVAD